MQIVIDIPGYMYKEIVEKEYHSTVDSLILDGVILPKEHGDLVDRDAINERFYGIWRELECCSNKPTYAKLLNEWSMCMDTAPRIIEADEGE